MPNQTFYVYWCQNWRPLVTRRWLDVGWARDRLRRMQGMPASWSALSKYFSWINIATLHHTPVMVHCPRDANTPHTFTRKVLHVIVNIRNIQLRKYPVKVSSGHLPCWRTVYRRAGGCWLLGIAGSVSGHCKAGRGEIIPRGHITSRWMTNISPS